MKVFHHSVAIADTTALQEYFLSALEYRKSHKDQSDEVARIVFNRSHPENLQFQMTKAQARLRLEFGALEAPGATSEPEQTQRAFEDLLWHRLDVLCETME